MINIKYKLSAAFLSVILVCLNFAAFSVKAESKLDMNKIDNYVKSRMKAEKILGASLGIVKGNKIIYLKDMAMLIIREQRLQKKHHLLLVHLVNLLQHLQLCSFNRKEK